MSQIESALNRIFDRHRVILWYDTKRELRQEFDAVALPGVEKIVVDNNEFGVKVRILREAPDHKFLLYHAGPPPANDLDNWLLDVQLAYGEFRADQVSLWLSEVGLGLEFADGIAPHAEFFRAARRRDTLKAILAPDDSPHQVRLKMLAVCVDAEPRIDDIVETLLAELAGGQDDRVRLITRAALEGFLWEELSRAFGYASATPTIRDFAIELFSSCYRMGVGDTFDAPRLTADAMVFLKRWKDSVRHHAAFETLSREYADILAIAQDLHGRDTASLIALDIFEVIDQKIISDLVADVAKRTIAPDSVAEIVRRRRQSHWYDRYVHEYEAVDHAAAFLGALDRADLTVGSFAAALTRYTSTWYALDQGYRKFIAHVRRSGRTTLLAPLIEPIERLYTNTFLLRLNNQWQAVMAGCEAWEAKPLLPQQDFFDWRVKPFLDRENKVFVVISDGMRYEIGEELLRLIRQEDRYDAELEPALTLLPSQTQLGMAALLPHRSVALADDGTTATVDGESATGTANRARLLAGAAADRATALRADDLLAMDRDASRALFRDNDVVYVYHNRIDAIGDKRDTEERVFDEVEEALQELLRIVKKLANANVTNMLITADHGFIYQNQPLDESDFISQEPAGTQITAVNRRYVLGRGLLETSSYKHFTAAQMGLDGDLEMLIPNSINRVRVKGAGSRYVHGGASLQEIVVPVLKINKKRESDVTQVDVDVLRGATSTITSGQLSVVFYQRQAVTEKVQPRDLRAGIYTQAGVLISDLHELHFDLTSTNERDREMPVRFMLTQKADDANGQEVILRLEERVEGTSHYREVSTVPYLLRRAFTSDFDL